MVIVTQNHYVVASKIHSVTLTEDYDYNDITVYGKRHTMVLRKYLINITYTSEPNPNSSRSDERHECSVTLRSKVNAHKVYKDLINQIREQMPDQLYLDKALENLLKQESPEEDSNDNSEEIIDVNAKPKKVHRARKAKRASKKVLRKSKKRR